MNKRTIYTAGGVALSLMIVVGGWFITDGMIDRKESDLLSMRGSVHVDAPQQTNPLPPDDSTITNAPAKLSASEIYTVLAHWELTGIEQPHEPTEGQLNMEQAFTMAEDWLAYFFKRRLIPSESLDYDTANAYLAKNVPNGLGISAQNPLVKLDDIRDGNLLEPFYSYWTVHLNGTAMSVTLIINAGTGQVWRAEINSYNASVNFNDIDATEIQNAFESYLNISNGYGILSISAGVRPGTINGEVVMGDAYFNVFAIYP